jgi:hypothetical protein
MKRFTPIKSLEELPEIKVGAIIGIGQLITQTIPAVCTFNDRKNIRALGNMDNKVIVEYDVPIGSIERLRGNGSIIFNQTKHPSKYYDEKSQEYEPKKQELINGGIWN